METDSVVRAPVALRGQPKSHTSRRGPLDASSCLVRPDGQHISEGPYQRLCVGRLVRGRPAQELPQASGGGSG